MQQSGECARRVRLVPGGPQSLSFTLGCLVGTWRRSCRSEGGPVSSSPIFLRAWVERYYRWPRRVRDFFQGYPLRAPDPGGVEQELCMPLAITGAGRAYFYRVSLPRCR